MISEQQWKEGCEFLGVVGDPLGFSSAPSLRADLSKYLDLLYKKNEELNLTAIRDPEVGFWKHIMDSLALAQWESLGIVLDWGSGGGLPGIPLALARRSVGDATPVNFLDSVGKKIKAIEEFGGALELSTSRFFNGRGEDLIKQGKLKGAETVVMRAVAPPERAVEWFHPAIKRWVLLLGPQQRELWAAFERRARTKGFHVEREAKYQLPHGHGDRVLLEFLRN